MDQDSFTKAAAKVLSDTTLLPVTIRIMDAWFVVSTLQLGVCHPEMSDLQKGIITNIARQFQDAIVALHPEANPLLNMGWDERFDVGGDDPSEDEKTPEPPVSLKTVNNCWTIYMDGLKEGESPLAQIGRPQDWGDPRWMYRVYMLEAQGYRNTVHCWVDKQMNEHEHLQLFSSLVTQIMLPGWPEKKSSRDFMREDDFWSSEWGEMPPHLDEDDEY